MTQRDQKNDEKKKKGYENDLVVDATPAPENESPIPSGHMRFYCDKCRAVRIMQMVLLLAPWSCCVKFFCCAVFCVIACFGLRFDTFAWATCSARSQFQSVRGVTERRSPQNRNMNGLPTPHAGSFGAASR